MTLDELAQHSGSDPAKPLCLAIKGTVFDVSKGSQFYGPDGASDSVINSCICCLDGYKEVCEVLAFPSCE
jgi:predicted heme/steroid binding protein